jgi:hypothetical protein
MRELLLLHSKPIVVVFQDVGNRFNIQRDSSAIIQSLFGFPWYVRAHVPDS